MSAPARRISSGQCEIIHGRLVGKDFAPLFDRFTRRDGFIPFDAQQEHPAPCPCLADKACGAFALRSFTAWARRRSAAIIDSRGAVSSTRGEAAPQSGQSLGFS